ncbi:MAG: MFS transporter [Candidatus Binatia bacterium]
MKEAAIIANRAEPLTPSVKALGFVSLLTDFSSEITVRTLPLFLANVLGVGTAVIGLIEGIAESTATLLKLISGRLSDRIGRRKVLALWGYGLSGFTKPLLYFATAGWQVVLAVRFLDRVGKGIRTAPKDALIADMTPPEHRGRAFGFNKAMDKTGAVIGLLIAAGVLHLTQGNSLALTLETYQWLVLLAVVPGLASVVVLAKWVEERPPSAAIAVTLRMKGLDGRFWAFIGLMVLFTLGNSSDAFLMLRAQTLGLSTVEVFLVVAAFNVVIAFSSTKGGALSDVFGRRGLIATGWLIYALIYCGFAFASSWWHAWLLYAGYGLYYGAFQGAATAFVADLAPDHLRGTAYGIFNAAIGIMALPASLLAGLLWQWYGPAAPFVIGATLALLATVGILCVPSNRSEKAVA